MRLPTFVPWPWPSPWMGVLLVGLAVVWGTIVIMMVLSWARRPWVSLLIAVVGFVWMLLCLSDALILLAPVLP
jgi:hypothetical protein